MTVDNTSSPTAARRPPRHGFGYDWTAWLRAVASVRELPAHDTPAAAALRRAASQLSPYQLTPSPVCLRPSWVQADLLDRLEREAATALETAGELHNGKRNAVVGPTAEELAETIDLAHFLHHATGVSVDAPRTANYIGYQREQALELHLDSGQFGAMNLLLCLRHIAPDGRQRSQTVFVTADGYQRFTLRRGDALIFDGALNPHG
jgi:hypothetical protein